MFEIILVAIFAAATLVGYKLIGNVPSLLHTPLMSGMNALSGITILGALVSTGLAVQVGHPISRYLGWVAVFLAMLNVAGGFGVTHRMLRMFQSGKGAKK